MLLRLLLLPCSWSGTPAPEEEPFGGVSTLRSELDRVTRLRLAMTAGSRWPDSLELRILEANFTAEEEEVFMAELLCPRTIV